MSMAEKAEKGKALDAKISIFLSRIAGLKDDSVPDRDLLQEIFDKNELQALWKRLETARGRKPSTVQEAWDDLKKLGGIQAKNAMGSTLAKFLVDPAKDEWVDFLVQTNEEIKQISRRSVNVKPLYKGELEQLHGKAEAARHIRPGKWKAGKDKDGELIYFKVSQEESRIRQHSESMNASRTDHNHGPTGRDGRDGTSL